MAALKADRIRHGIRAIDDPDLLAELKDKQIVLDVCPTSNLRTRSVPDLASHPLPRLHRGRHLLLAGTPTILRCSAPISAANTRLPSASASGRKALFEAGIKGAMCDEKTKARLRDVEGSCNWTALAAPASEGRPA